MKVLPFQVPKTLHESFHIQIDKGPHFYDSLHSHPEIQITYITESIGTIVAGSYVGNFVPGQLYVIGSGQPHVFKNDPEYFKGSPDFMAHSISVFIRKEMFGAQFMQLPEVVRLQEFFGMSDRGILFHTETGKKIYPLLINILNEDGLAKLGTLFQILKLLSDDQELYFLSPEVAHKGFNEADGKRLNEIYQFSLREFHREITLQEVAALANLAPNSFCRYFKNRTRKSYVHFLSEIRIGYACKLLRDKDKSISTVCYSSGFSNLSNFNRQFKSFTGKTPKEYRESIRSV